MEKNVHWAKHISISNFLNLYSFLHVGKCQLRNGLLQLRFPDNSLAYRMKVWVTEISFLTVLHNMYIVY